MFYVVNSNNRHAVRKLLTAAGVASSEVVGMRNGLLGKTMSELVKSGKIDPEAAKEACRDNGEPGPANWVEVSKSKPVMAGSEPYAEPVAVATKPNKQLIAAQVAELLAKLAADDAQPAAMDKAAVLQATMETLSAVLPAMLQQHVQPAVAEALRAEQAKPAIIEIRDAGEIVTKMDGETTHVVFQDVLKIINTRVAGRRLHAWLAGPSGSGKSHIAHQAATALSLPFYTTGAIQSKYELVGYISPSGDTTSLQTPFRKAFETGGVFAWDDIDASNANAFAAFNEALANGRFAFPDRVVTQHEDFVCIASANTWGTGATADYVGRNKIDGATLTRFVRVMVAYDEKLERALVGRDHEDWARFIQRVRAAAQREGLKILITPRHTLQGAGLLASGMPRGRVEEVTVFAGLEESTVAKLRRAA